MAQIEPAGISDAQQPVVRPVASVHPVSTQRSQRLENHNQKHTAVASQGKEAMVHDFLSICGTGRTSSSTLTLTSNGSQQSITQDLLQPLQNDLNPGGTNFLPHAFVLGGATSHMSGGAGEQSSYAIVGNGSFQLPASFPSKHRSSTISFGAKAQVPQALPINKLWQLQQEVLEGNKRLTKVPSDDDDDDESYDHSYGARKEIRNQKSETVTQQGEGRSMDSKGMTPRSKHSATEQRRRSKINDRFQMLRQLLPNADQKRDKASFLLEVIEHIQMLHEKVKKYEAAEVKGPLQERSKVLSWDKNSSQQDLPTHDAREAADLNGYVKGHLSPLRVMSEDGVTSSELRGHVVQVPAFQGCVSTYESKPTILKPIPLTFSHHPMTSTVDRVSDPMHQPTIPQQLMPERHSMFGQFFCTEEPVAFKARCPLPNQDLQLRRSSEKTDEFEGQVQVNQVVADIGSTSKDSDDRDRTAVAANDGSDLERRTAVAANEQEAPAMLGGVINISSVYSQGLLDTLTRALQSSGVDMAQASISVQIDLGKPGGSVLPTSKQMASLVAGTLPCPPMKGTASTQESERPAKRPKIEAE